MNFFSKCACFFWQIYKHKQSKNVVNQHAFWLMLPKHYLLGHVDWLRSATFHALRHFQPHPFYKTHPIHSSKSSRPLGSSGPPDPSVHEFPRKKGLQNRSATNLTPKMTSGPLRILTEARFFAKILVTLKLELDGWKYQSRSRFSNGWMYMGVIFHPSCSLGEVMSWSRLQLKRCHFY